MLRSLLIAPAHAVVHLTGGGQRTINVYRALERLGDVDVAVVGAPNAAVFRAGLESLRADYPRAGKAYALHSDAWWPAAPAEGAGRLGRLWYLAKRAIDALKPQARLYRPRHQTAAELSRALASNEYDVIVGRYLQWTSLAGAFDQSRVPVLVDLDDVDEHIFSSRIASPTTRPARRALLRHHAWQVGRIAKRLRAKCRHVFTASDDDQPFVNHASMSTLPNIPFDPSPGVVEEKAPSVGGEPIVLFVGTHLHRPNRDGLVYFVERCWPKIRARFPSARLRVVGSGGWETERDLLERKAGVEVVGVVEDLTAEYGEAALCVVPVFEGAGTKIKVLEALRYGRPVVATKHAVHGQSRLIGNGVVVGLDDAGLADECVRLLGDPAERERLGALGRCLVDADYSFDVVFRSIRKGLVEAGVLSA